MLIIVQIRSTISYGRNIMSKVTIGTTVSTGQTCPESGVWKSLDTPSTTAPIARGNRMPPHNGKAVTWKLTQYA